MTRVKFKASITDSNALLNFTRIVNGLAKLSKMCAVHLSPGEMVFCPEEPGVGKPVFQVCVGPKTLFSVWEVIGTDSDNELCLTINAMNLSKTLKCISNQTKSLKIQLARKNNFEILLKLLIDQPTDSNAGYRQVTHYVPIEFMSHQRWLDIQASSPVSPDVALQFPSFKMLTAIVSKTRISERRLTFQVIADFSKKEALVEMITNSQVRKSTSKFRPGPLTSLINFCSQSNPENATQEQWLMDLQGDRQTKFLVSVDSTALHNLLSAFTEAAASMVFAVCENEYALVILRQYEVRIMYILPHFNQN